MKILEILEGWNEQGHWEENDYDWEDEMVNPHKDDPESYRKFTHPGRKIKLNKKFHKNIKGKFLGKGWQARAYQTDPGTVTKSVRFAHPSDGHIQFLVTASKHQDNPFFPRIYEMRTHKTNEPELNILHVEMEKLHPLTQENFREAATMLFKNVGAEISDKAVSMMRDDPKATRSSLPDETKIVYDAHYFDNFLHLPYTKQQKILSKVKNDKFVEFVEIMKDMIKDQPTDFHSGNFMVRLTSHGPQLVLVDPLYPDEAASDHWYMGMEGDLPE